MIRAIAVLWARSAHRARRCSWTAGDEGLDEDAFVWPWRAGVVWAAKTEELAETLDTQA